ncbi:MAG: DMT family transporter [Pseudomonadota bacterium]
MLWILTTLIAAAAQTARNAMQRGLTSVLGTLGATQVRFLYGFPFALVFLAIAVMVTHAAVPPPNARFVEFTIAGGVAQILGTALLLAAMKRGSFSVATALSKTEAVQIALFGLLILGDHLNASRALAIGVATAGVAITALKPGGKWTTASMRPALLGIAAGGGFALASVGFRGSILALGDGSYWLRATTALVWSLGVQTLLLGAWMLCFARGPLLASLRLWRQSLPAGFFGAFASQFWFLGFALTAAANVRTLALVEVVFAQIVGQRVMRQRASRRELAGMALIVIGVGLLLALDYSA